MTEIIARLADISARYDAILCDLWGCLHNGVAPFPDAVAALQMFRANGGKVILLTNAPRPKSAVVKQLDGMGVPRDVWDDVVTSGDAAQYAMLTGAVGRNLHHIGAPKDMPFFTEFSADLAKVAAAEPPFSLVPINEAEGIICTGLTDDLTQTPDDYRGTLLMAKTLGLPMLCANPDIVVHFGDRLLYCAGALAQAYEKMGGKALYFGKPHPPIYDLARRRLAALGLRDEGAILAIGDGIATDIQGAMSENLDAVFITGGIDATAFGSDPANPDLALLDAWLAVKQQSPTFALGQLR